MGGVVRRISLVSLLAVVCACWQTAQAESPLDDLMGGEVQLAVPAVGLGGSCYVNRGFSTFQRRGFGKKAVISFTELVDSQVWDLSGQAILTFNTASSGFIKFEKVPTAPTAVSNPPFTNYAQTFDPVARHLVVNFNIIFPDCVLPIVASYNN
jgi:hypothetical protein